MNSENAVTQRTAAAFRGTPPWSWRRLLLLCLPLALLCASAAWAIINPNFTPTDLIRGSAQVFQVEVSAPKDGGVAARIVETIRGKTPEQQELRMSIGELLDAEKVALVFDQRPSKLAMVFLRAETADDEHAAAGFIQIGTQWFALSRGPEGLTLNEDGQQMFSVWGGSARLLAKAARYVVSDPWADFPVRSEVVWSEAIRLGQLPGPASGALALDLGATLGRCVLLLAASGDHLWQLPPQGGTPQDITQQVGLATASKRAVPADMDNDGRLDLLAWDGKSLNVLTRTEDGRFAPPRQVMALKECLSLDVVGMEGNRAALVVGTPSAPLLLTPDGAGGLNAGPLPEMQGAEAAEDLGPGGFCVVADLNGNGQSDVLQLFAHGARFWVAESQGRFKSPALVKVRLPANPGFAVLGDFAGDATLDVMVGGQNGMAFLSRHEEGAWKEHLAETYELGYHGNQGLPHITGMSLVDVNADGRQGVARFAAAGKPMLFFNRGFGCFGMARELDIAPAAPAAAQDGAGRQLPELQALEAGQSVATVADLGGDGILGLFAVAAGTHEVWAVLGARDDGKPARTLEVALPPKAASPVTVTVRDGNRSSAMHVVRPGMPAMIARGKAGPAVLEWTDFIGNKQSKKVVVLGMRQRIELVP